MKIYILLSLLVFTGCVSIKKQNMEVFFPEKLTPDYSFPLTARVEEVSIPVAPNLHLNGLHYKASQSKGLILYFQGNAKNLQNWLDHHNMVMEWGYDVLVYDYRGFGKSDGSLRGQQQLYADAEKVYAFALELGYKAEEIILYGYSLGTAMAIHVGALKPARVLILESPFSSIRELNWIGKKAPAYRLDSKAKAKNVRIPTLLVHGDQDEVIPIEHAYRLFDHLQQSQRQLSIIRGGGHGNFRGSAEYTQIVGDFLSAY